MMMTVIGSQPQVQAGKWKAKAKIKRLLTCHFGSGTRSLNGVCLDASCFLPADNNHRYISQPKSSDEDEDSDDSIKLVDINKTPNAHGNLKRKRGNEKKRSRSKSITPPPEVPKHQLQNVKGIVRWVLGLEFFTCTNAHDRKTLGVTRATSSPDLDDDFKLDDTQNRLDPELAEYARKHAQSHPRATSSGPEDKVTVRVRWQPHPQDPSGKKTITEFRLEKVCPLFLWISLVNVL